MMLHVLLHIAVGISKKRNDVPTQGSPLLFFTRQTQMVSDTNRLPRFEIFDLFFILQDKVVVSEKDTELMGVYT